MWTPLTSTPTTTERAPHLTPLSSPEAPCCAASTSPLAPAPLYLSCPLVILVFVYVFIYVCVHVCSHTGAIVCVPGGGVVRGVRRQPIFHHVGPEGQTQALRQASTPALSEAWRPLPSEAFTAEEELQGEHSGGCTPSTCVPTTDKCQLMSHKGTS